MSLQLVCINYGNIEDAITVVKHCKKVFPRFDKAIILHPELQSITLEPSGAKFYPDVFDDIGIVQAKSKTQNECCMYEMPQYITCDHAIGIQWDGFITNPSAWTDEFLEYDYIAPPWPITNIVNPEWRVGSGGFMMFSKKMANLWADLCQPHPFPNDWSMGAVNRNRFEAHGIKYAPLELAMRFGEEIPLDDKPRIEKPFGIHGKQYDSENRKKYFEMIYGK